MDFQTFKGSLAQSAPPEPLKPHLKALWYDGKEDWEMSHNIAQDILDDNGSWIHAYLHRKEGDLGNAGYWYRRAGRSVADGSLEEEWEQIATALLRDV